MATEARVASCDLQHRCQGEAAPPGGLDAEIMIEKPLLLRRRALQAHGIMGRDQGGAMYFQNELKRSGISEWEGWAIKHTASSFGQGRVA
jgi:hypothetical protein